MILVFGIIYYSITSAGLQAGWSGVLGFDSWWGLGIFLFTTVSRTALGPTQPPTQRVPGSLSLGVKQPGHEADHSPPYSAKVKYGWSYASTPQYAFMARCLVKHRDNLTFLPFYHKVHIDQFLELPSVAPLHFHIIQSSLLLSLNSGKRKKSEGFVSSE
jgi:hypothetical protein